MRRHAPQGSPRISTGFTLIETLLTALILAPLSSVVWASYRDALLRAHRSEASTELSQLQFTQVRCYLDNRSPALTRNAGRATTRRRPGPIHRQRTRNATPSGLVLAEDGQHYVASARCWS
jgi:Tfp pilus assembly protein PilE